MGIIRYTPREKNLCLQNGQALIELVLGMGLSLLFFTVCIQSFWLVKERVENHQEALLLYEEAAAFVHYLEREMAGAKDIQISRERILFSNHGNRFDYRKQEERMIRQKNGLGYVTVCFYVKDFGVYPLSQGIKLKLVLERNHTSIEVVMNITPIVDTS